MIGWDLRYTFLKKILMYADINNSYILSALLSNNYHFQLQLWIQLELLEYVVVTYKAYLIV